MKVDTDVLRRRLGVSISVGPEPILSSMWCHHLSDALQSAPFTRFSHNQVLPPSKHTLLR